jgi:tight adherence protein C
VTWSWWIIIATVASVVLTGAATVFFVLGFHGYVLRPLAEQAGPAGPAGVRGVTRGAAGAGLGWALIRRLGAANRSFMWPRYEAKMRRQLVKAALSERLSPEDILAFQELAGLGGLIFGLFVCARLHASFVWAGMTGVAFGLYPLLWVSDQVKKRHHLISRALPYAIDLLTLSVEAGLDFTGALAKVVEKGRAGPLRDELQIVLKQLKMGKTREEALKGLAERVGLPSMSSFISTLIQADRMGTSLGKVLRAQSAQMRMDRTQRAEKLAAEAPVKMLGPLIICIFPTVFMILFGPIAFAFIYGGAAG